MRIVIAHPPRVVVHHEGIDLCAQTSYAAMPFVDRYPAIPGAYEMMVSQGDPILRPCYPSQPYGGNSPLTSWNRGADRIRLSVRPPGSAIYQPFDKFMRIEREGGNIVIGNHKSFWWMDEEGFKAHGGIPGYRSALEFLTANPQACIGATAAPTVIKINGIYYYFFVATLADPYVTTAEHPRRTQYMPVGHDPLDPWAYGALYVVAGPDPTDPKLLPMGRQNDNIALRYAALYYEPAANEIGTIDYGREVNGQTVYDGTNMGVSSFKGIGGFTMFREEDFTAHRTYLIFSFGLWTTYGSKQLLARLPVGGRDMRDFEVWGGWQDARWIKVNDGRLPEWTNKDRGRGPVNAHGVHQIASMPYVIQRHGSPVGSYIFTSSNDNGRTIALDYANKLTEWLGTIPIESTIPRFLDGTGQDGQVRYPVIQETGGKLLLIGSTSDAGIISGDLSRCGSDLCGASFVGAQVFEAELEVVS